MVCVGWQQVPFLGDPLCHLSLRVELQDHATHCTFVQTPNTFNRVPPVVGDVINLKAGKGARSVLNHQRTTALSNYRLRPFAIYQVHGLGLNVVCNVCLGLFDPPDFP